MWLADLAGIGIGFLAACHKAVTEKEPDSEEEYEREMELEPTAKLVPDTVPENLLNKPQIGSQHHHGNALWEEAAVLASLRDALASAGFDPDETWHLTSSYADIWWTAKYVDMNNMNMAFAMEDDDDD